MQIPDSLQTIAEISIAFAGFSGLIVALRRDTGPFTDLEKYRLQILLTLAFGAMFLSLLPEILKELGFQGDSGWVLASSVHLVYSSVFLVWWLYTSRGFAKIYPEVFNRFAYLRMVTGHVVVIVLLFAVVFSAFEERGAAIYQVGLVWFLIHAAQQFARMLFVRPGSGSAD